MARKMTKSRTRGKSQHTANGSNKGASAGKVRMRRVPGTKTMARPKINDKGK